MSVSGLVPARSSLLLHQSRTRSISQFVSVSDLGAVHDDDLVNKVNNLKRAIRILDLENLILEATLMRVDPALMQGVQQAYEYAIKISTASTLNLAQTSFMRSPSSRLGMENSSRILVSPSRASTKKDSSTRTQATTVFFSSGPRINIMERLELTGTEMQVICTRMEKTRALAAKQHALLRARLEEIAIRNAGVDKSTESFDQQVIIKGLDKITKRIPAEVWVRYMTELASNIDKEIGRLRMRISTGNAQFAKLNGQICTKTELSKNLFPVDFEKLEIENKICLRTLDARLKQLASIKAMVGDGNLNLSIHNKAIKAQDYYLKKIRNDIHYKVERTKRLVMEKEKIATQVETYETKYEEVKKLTGAYETPSILEYVGIKEEAVELKRAIKALEHRVHVQQIHLKSLQLHLQEMNDKPLLVGSKTNNSSSSLS